MRWCWTDAYKSRLSLGASLFFPSSEFLVVLAKLFSKAAERQGSSDTFKEEPVAARVGRDILEKMSGFFLTKL